MPLLSSDDLSDGLRILKIDIDRILETNGPVPTQELWDSIDELKSNDLKYLELKKTNPNRAHSITRPEKIVGAKEFLITPTLDRSHREIIRDMEHLFTGGHKVNIVGMHYFDPETMRIVELTKAPDNKGIWEAILEYYQPITGKWKRKGKPTTIFPSQWDKHQTLFEIASAIESKEKFEPSNSLYRGMSKSGVVIEFVVHENGNIITFYPIHGA